MSEADARAITDIDRDLARELAIDPSPEFVARVRVAVRERGLESRTWPWMWIRGAAALAVLAIVVVLIARRGPATPDGRVTVRTVGGSLVTAGTSPTASRAAPPPPSAAVASILENRTPVRATARPGTMTAPRRPNVEPEVLVDPAEARALKRWLALRPGVRIDETAVDEPVADPTVTKELTIEPLKIDLLPAPTPLNVTGTGTPPADRIERPRDLARSAW